MNLLSVGNVIEKHGLKAIDECIAQTQVLLSNANEEEAVYIKYFQADLFILKGRFEEALDIYSSTLNHTSMRTHVANLVLNLKYELNRPMESVDIIPMERKFTKYGLDNIEKIIPYLDLLLKEFHDISKKDFLDYFGIKYEKERHYPITLFNGYNFGFKAEILFYRQPYAFYGYCFYSIDEFRDLCLFLSRRSENMFRSSIGKRKLDDIPITENTLHFIHNIILQYKKYVEANKSMQFTDYIAKRSVISHQAITFKEKGIPGTDLP